MTTDFEKRAIEVMQQAGISMEHIQLQKRTVFQETHVESYYDKVENSEHPSRDIPVQKIIAIKTDETIEGNSVYDLFMGIANEGRETEKIEDQLRSLEKNGIAYQRAVYSGNLNLEGPSPISFNYYKEDDCYILQDDGIDQTIAAKMFGAPVMSGIVTIYELNEENKQLYEEYDSLKDLLRLTDIKGLTLDLFQDKKNKK